MNLIEICRKIENMEEDIQTLYGLIYEMQENLNGGYISQQKNTIPVKETTPNIPEVSKK